MSGKQRDWEASVWVKQTSEPHARRARSKPDGPSALSRDRLVAAAVRLLDRHGLAKFSMRALAADLNTSAMSAYWHVDNKDDLLELALDQIFGEAMLPASEDGADIDWRLRAASFAAVCRSVMLRHPWAVHIFGDYLNIGPNAERFSSLIHEIIGHSGLPADQVNFAAGTFSQFVFGFAQSECQWLERFDSEAEQQELYRKMVTRLMDGEHWEQLRPVLEGPNGEGFDIGRHWSESFSFGVETVIAGIETMAARVERPVAATAPTPTPDVPGPAS
jgi:AcrR family transcriptional regulator